MKTIGVLGGLGPQATMDFETRVHSVSQRLIPPMANSGYPPMVVYYHRNAPFRHNEDGSSAEPLQLDPHLVGVLEKLGSLADFLVITANGPHILREAIQEASGLKVLSMVDLALQDVDKRGWRKVGVLGLGVPHVYLEPLGRTGIESVTIPADLRERLDRAIRALMEGRENEQDRRAALDAVEYLRSAGVEGTILGCTEIPLLLREHSQADDLINPGELLAEAAVRCAIE
jgi:aspartate racemase